MYFLSLTFTSFHAPHHAPRITILRGDLLRRLMLNYGGLGLRDRTSIDDVGER